MPDWTEDGVLQVASLNDLFATKIKVLLQRVEAKDYLDVAAMLEHGADLAKGLASARTLYGERFQPAECLKALIYFKGGDLPSLPRDAVALDRGGECSARLAQSPPLQPLAQ